MASLGSYKLSPAQHWDSDSNPYGFNDWIKEMSSLVRTLKKGNVDSRCTMEDWILFVLMRSFDAGHELSLIHI